MQTVAKSRRKGEVSSPTERARGRCLQDKVVRSSFCPGYCSDTLARRNIYFKLYFHCRVNWEDRNSGLGPLRPDMPRAPNLRNDPQAVVRHLELTRGYLWARGVFLGRENVSVETNHSHPPGKLQVGPRSRSTGHPEVGDVKSNKLSLSNR